MKKHLLKAMLVSAMTLMASGAWAEATTLYERGGEGTAWSAADLSEWTASQTEGIAATIADNSFLITVSKSGDGGKTGEYTASIGTTDAQSILSYTINWNPGNATGRNDSSNGYVKFGDVEFHYYGQNKIARATIAGTTTDICGWNRNTAVTLTVTVDQATGAVSYVWGNTSGTGVSQKAGQFTTFTVGYGGTVPNWENQVRLSSLVITETKQNVETATYQVRYVDANDNEIKDAETRTGVVGQDITLLASDMENFFNEDSTVKYIYVSNDASGATVAEGGTTVITVKFRQAEYYGYTLTDNTGATLTVGSNFEGETVAVPYPRYQLKESTFYEAAATNKEYRKPIALTANNATATVDYTEKSDVNVVFYKEGEEIAGFAYNTEGNIPVRASNAAAGAATEDVTITSLEPGKYKLHVGIFTSKTGFAGQVVNFAIGEQTFAAAFGAVNLNEVASEEYTLNADTDVKFIAEGSWEFAQLDYIWIEKTGDVEASGDAAAIATLKAQLQEAVNQAKVLAANSLKDAIADAEAAIASESITLTELQLAAANFDTAVRNYAKNALGQLLPIAEMVKDDSETFAATYVAAKAVYENEASTTEQLVAALKQLAEAAMPVAAKYIAEVKAYLATFDKSGEAILNPLFDDLQAEMAKPEKDFAAIRAKILNIVNNAMPVLKTGIEKLEPYAEEIKDATLDADIADIKDASAANNLPALFKALKQYENDFSTVARDYLTKVKAMDLTGKKGADAVNAAITALETALAANPLVLMDVAVATRDLVNAVKALDTTGISEVVKAAVESGDIYTISGQQVKSAKKGLYIINGKKQIVK